MTARTLLKVIGLALVGVCLVGALQSIIHNNDAANCAGFLLGALGCSIVWTFVYGLANSAIGSDLDI